MNTKKLIVNADDFGQSKGINEGIIRSHEKGIVTSASLMVRYSEVEYAAAYAKRNPSLGIGLHIDLGEWTYEGGEWMPIYQVVDLNDTIAVDREIRNQLESFLQIMGKKPTHIDSHQHIHLRQEICKVVENIALEMNATLRRCNGRVNYCGDFYGMTRDGSTFPEAISTNGLIKIIKKLKEGITEMACHPASMIDIKTMYGAERKQEVRALCDSAAFEMIVEENIMLCNFRGIGF